MQFSGRHVHRRVAVLNGRRPRVPRLFARTGSALFTAGIFADCSNQQRNLIEKSCRGFTGVLLFRPLPRDLDDAAVCWAALKTEIPRNL